MADTNTSVSIKVNIDADGVSAGLIEIERRLKALESRSDRIGGKGNRSIARNIDRMGHSFKKTLQPLGSMVAGFGKLWALMTKVNFIAMAAELGVFTLGLLAVKLALITGRAAASLWQIAMKGVSVAAATVATGLAVAAAAMREFNEAQMIPFMGGGAVGARGARHLSRGLGVRNQGLLGGQGAMQVSGAMARGGFRGQNSAALVSALINASGGADPAAIASVLKQTTVQGAVQAASSLAGIKQDSLSGVTSFSQLTGALTSGQNLKEGFGGTGATLANTFLGTVKTGFADMKGLFGDIGAPMLGPMRDAFLQINQILRENFMVLQSIIQKFGADSMAPTMVTIFDRMMKWITKNVIGHLDRIKEMGENFVGFFRAVKNFFVGMGNWLVQFEPAANVIIDMFKAGSKANSSSLFRDLNDLIVKNRPQLMAFGEAIGNLFGGVFDLFAGGNRGFFNKIPVWINAINAMTDKLFPAIQTLWEQMGPTFEKLPNVIAGLASAIEIVAPYIGMLARAIVQVMSLVPQLTGLVMLGMMGPGRKMLGGAIGAGKMFGKATFGTRAAMAAGGTGALQMTGAAGGGTVFRNVAHLRGAQLANLPGMAGRFFGSSAGLSAVPNAASIANAGWAPNVTASAMRSLGPATWGQVIGGTLSAAGGIYMGYKGIQGMVGGMGDAYSTGRFTGKGAMGAATALAGYSMIGGPLTMGAAAAVIATAVAVEAILAWYGNKNFKKETREALDETWEKRDSERNRLMGQGRFGADKVAELNKEAELLERAIGAGFDDKGNWKGEGDTKEMREYMRFIGQEDKHHDAALAHAVDTGQLAVLREDIQAAEDFRGRNIRTITGEMNASFKEMGMAISVTAEQAERLAEELYNVDLYTSVSPWLSSMIVASQSLMNRNQAFQPNFIGSVLARNESMHSADAALNALVNDFNLQNLTGFTTAFSAYEVNRGMSADIAGLSSILEIEQQAEAGVFGTNKAAALNAASIAKTQMLADIGAAYNIPSTTLREIWDQGGPAAIESYLARQQNIRSAISGVDPTMSHQERLRVFSDVGGIDLATDHQFMRNMGGRLEASDIGMSAGTAFDNMSEVAKYERLVRLAEEGGQGGAYAQILNETMNEWMLDSDNMDGKRNQLLKEIIQAINEKPVLFVDGEESGLPPGDMEIIAGPGEISPGGREPVTESYGWPWVKPEGT